MQPPKSAFQLTITKSEDQTKQPTTIRLDFEDDTTLHQARKLAVELRRTLKPYYSIQLLVDEDYSPKR